jgi:hypothetical protein
MTTLSTADIINDLNKNIMELKYETSRAELYLSYLETDLSNIEIKRKEYNHYLKQNTSNNWSNARKKAKNMLSFIKKRNSAKQKPTVA